MKKTAVSTAVVEVANLIIRLTGEPSWRRRQGWGKMLQFLALIDLRLMRTDPKMRKLAAWIAKELNATK